jgi:hypothetical protein
MALNRSCAKRKCQVRQKVGSSAPNTAGSRAPRWCGLAGRAPPLADRAWRHRPSPPAALDRRGNWPNGWSKSSATPQQRAQWFGRKAGIQTRARWASTYSHTVIRPLKLPIRSSGPASRSRFGALSRDRAFASSRAIRTSMLRNKWRRYCLASKDSDAGPRAGYSERVREMVAGERLSTMPNLALFRPLKAAIRATVELRS